MLVLSRKRNERIIIDGGRIVITLVDLRGDKARIGVEADPEISIHREEVQVEVDREAREKADALLRDERARATAALPGGLGKRPANGAGREGRDAR